MLIKKRSTIRQLEKSTYRNIEVMWLIGKLRPDFKTIADFRKDNTNALKKVFGEFVMLFVNRWICMAVNSLPSMAVNSALSIIMIAIIPKIN